MKIYNIVVEVEQLVARDSHKVQVGSSNLPLGTQK